MNKEDLITLRTKATNAAALYSVKAEFTKRVAADPTATSELKVDADIEAAKALNASYAAEQKYKQALQEYVNSEPVEVEA